MITVRDIWRGVLPAGTELLGGGSGLERRIDWATALRTKPPAFESLRGGELAFIPVSRIRLIDERLDLAQVMASLAEKGGAAVAVMGEISSEAIAVADRMMLPLLKLPEETSLTEIQHQAVRFILDERTELSEREHQVRLELTEMALAGRGVIAIVDRLAEIIGVPVVWQDEEGAVKHESGDVALGDAELQASIETVSRSLLGVEIAASDPPVREVDGDVARVVAPIAVRSGIGGYISAVVTAPEHAQLARLGVARAASACAIEIDRDRAVLAVREDIEGDLATALLLGEYGADDAVAERCHRLDVDITQSNVVIILAPGTASAATLESSVALVRRWAEQQALAILVTVYRSAICVICSQVTEAQQLVVAAQRLLDDISAMSPHLQLAVGVGRAGSGPAAVHASYNEATQAAAIGRRLHGSSRAVAFADLGLYRLLSAMSHAPELRTFHSEVLGRLLAYDERAHADLLPTMDAFFACNGSPTEMAAHLGLHRNTVLYRLRRIHEVAGVDLDDPMARLSLHLGLRIGEILEAGGRAAASG